MILHVETTIAPPDARSLCTVVLWFEDHGRTLNGEIVAALPPTAITSEERHVMLTIIADGLYRLADRLVEETDGGAAA